MKVNIEPNSNTWCQVKAWAEEQKLDVQQKLAQPGLEDRPTELQRGRLQQLNALLDLANPPKGTPAPSTQY